MGIGEKIISWYETDGRNLEWRETRDPYKIWISEIILQQTRIQQGINYYYRFIERFPDVYSLADAEQDEVLKYWEGLGYYSRARNLHAGAKFIVEEWEGQFRDHHSELIKIKGVGPYTARAIGSFAFGNETGVIDGNVLRVMSRVLGDFSPIDQQSTRKQFQIIIDQWVAGKDSRAFNHGMMDLGATVCTPTKPGCLLCPLESECKARAEGSIHLLPQKAGKLNRKTRYFHFYLIRSEKEEILIRQRAPEGLWGGLWEIPNREFEKEVWERKEDHGPAKFEFEMKHVFTHFDMMIHVFSYPAGYLPSWADGQFVSTDKISIFAFSKAVLKIFGKMLKKGKKTHLNTSEDDS